MISRSLAASGCLAAALAFGVAACGGDDDSGGGGGGGGDKAKSVTMYSSFPLQGASRSQTTAVVNGIKLALEQVGGKAGDITVTYKSLDDSTAQAGNWTPEATSANARKAAQDESTAVYLGEFNSGATAVSLPILNEAGVPQISPANTAVGLTTDEPGAEPGEPDKYYPSGERTYARIVPEGHDPGRGARHADEGGRLHEGPAPQRQGGLRRRPGAQHRVVRQGAGPGRSSPTRRSTRTRRTTAPWPPRPRAPARTAWSSRASSPTTRSRSTRTSRPPCPNAKLYGPDGVAESDFADPKQGLPANVGAKTKVTIATLSPDQYPQEGQKFFDGLQGQVRRQEPGPVRHLRLRGARLALDAIERSGTGEKADVLKALFETKDRESVLGTYSIDENGDTSLTDYGVYSIKDGELTFDETIKAKGG